ncbi:MAG TPA: succinate dehydrogenase cytochrome b558 subunit [Phycisphaerae bacterium]|nr:succinate dehydrogenase cytochrome b558 subunit [Phycisphaerae bacterium]
MATPLPDTPTFDEKHHFLLRKLHSLTGIVPIGVFLIEHLLTNSLAAGWASKTPGPERFNEAVHGLHHLPYLWALELFGIFLPLAFHALYGVKIALTAQPNAREYPYMANRRYTLQRVTGYIALVFIIVHLLKFRFAHWVGWGPEFIGSENPYEITRTGLTQWRITQLGLVVPVWITLSFYLLGLAASVYHFANGIWTFCISWGITVGAQAQRKMGYACAAVGIVLFLWGGMSLYAFARTPLDAKAAPKTMAVQQVNES